MALPLLAIPAAVQGLTGLGQFLFSGQNKARKEMEKMAKNSPMYKGGGSIMDYYNRALQRSTAGLTDTAAYKTQMQNIGAGTSQGIGALQDRRSGLAGIGGLIGNQTRLQQNAVVNAEQEQNRRFNQLGSAAQMKTGEETKRYQYNQLNPYLRQFQLAQQKAAAAANTKQTGIQNLFQAGANTMAAMSGGQQKQASPMSSGLSDTNALSKLQVNSGLNKYSTKQVNPLSRLQVGRTF